MASVIETIDVNKPIRTVYNQWTQFEEFPKFMEGVKSVQQADDTHLRWVADVGGEIKQWDAEITEQHADERVAWQSTSGAKNAGVVTFHRIDDATTRVTLQMDVEPDGVKESVGTALGFLQRRVEGDLERFGQLLHEHWLNKKKRSRKISDDQLDEWYSIARENGARGGKIMGAGGGGFFMFYCPNSHKPGLRKALSEAGLREMRYNFDFEGAKVLVNL